jgi:hypothetical protein
VVDIIPKSKDRFIERPLKDDHDSWGMCTTSAEYKTVITAVVTVMRGMDPHMIS